MLAETLLGIEDPNYLWKECLTSFTFFILTTKLCQKLVTTIFMFHHIPRPANRGSNDHTGSFPVIGKWFPLTKCHLSTN